MTQSIRFVDRADLERSEAEVARLVEDNRRLEERLAHADRLVRELRGNLVSAEERARELEVDARDHAFERDLGRR